MKIKLISLTLILLLLLCACSAEPSDNDADVPSDSGEIGEAVGDGKPVNVTKDTFGDEVLKSDKTVLVDFWAEWCPPCKMLSPIMDEIASEYPDIKVCKVNVDEEPELASQFGAMSIPLVLAFKDGQIINRQVGYTTKENILKLTETD